MVRVNLIDPVFLADQHLVAEYDEILMLLGYVRKFPQDVDIPPRYLLGPGHIKFFKNKLLYLKNRHEKLKQEMKKRGFNPTKKISLSEFPENLINDYTPTARDIKIIKKRIRQKIILKPDYYRYYSEKRKVAFFLSLLRK